MITSRWQRFTFWLSLIRACLRRKMHDAPSSVLLVLATTYIEAYGTVEQRFGRKLPTVTHLTVSHETVLAALGPLPDRGGMPVPPEYYAAVRAWIGQDIRAKMDRDLRRALGEEPYEEPHER